MSARKVTWRGECLHCGKRQKVLKTTKKIGSHFLGGGDTYCPGVGLDAVEGTVREYIAPVRIEYTYEAPAPPMHAVYKWAIVALLALLAVAVIYFVGEVITK